MDLFDGISPTGLSPIIKWAGGKEKELSFIFSNAPHSFDRFFEPFVGGGSVFAAFPASQYFINDKSEELIDLYRSVANQSEDFFLWIDRINSSWIKMLDFVDCNRVLCNIFIKYRESEYSNADIKTIIEEFVNDRFSQIQSILSSSFIWKRYLLADEIRKNLTRKIYRMRRIELQKHVMPFDDVFDNIETAFMSALYMYYRGLYNDADIMSKQKELSTAVFVFVRNFAYGGMFRYNDRGEFNVPYGGIGYNHKLMTKKIDYYRSKSLQHHFSSAMIYNMDFEDFFKTNPPKENDFIFLDPPYDSEFCTYAKNEFTKDDQQRLANYLINECKGKWMMIVKNTPFICSIYDNPKLTIKSFNKKYLVSFMNRNDKKAEHLIIMNY